MSTCNAIFTSRKLIYIYIIMLYIMVTLKNVEILEINERVEKFKKKNDIHGILYFYITGEIWYQRLAKHRGQPLDTKVIFENKLLSVKKNKLFTIWPRLSCTKCKNQIWSVTDVTNK